MIPYYQKDIINQLKENNISYQNIYQEKKIPNFTDWENFKNRWIKDWEQL